MSHYGRDDVAQLEEQIIDPHQLTEHTHTVILLHGRGSTVAEFVSGLEATTDPEDRNLFQLLPTIRWVFPQSEMRTTARPPVECIPQWYDNWNISQQRPELQIMGLRESVASLRAIAKREADRLGGRWERVVIGGYSQGASAAAHTLLNLSADGEGEQRLGGLMVFGSVMAFPGKSLAETRAVLELDGVPSGDEVVRNAPVLWQHCLDDKNVKVKYGRELRDSFRGFGSQLTAKEYRKGGHWLNSPEGVGDVVTWLKEHVVHTSGPAEEQTTNQE